MALWNLFVVFLAFQVLGKAKCSMVKLNNGGYEDIVIAINPAVPEDPKIIENIQNMMKDATSYLFQATKQRLYIRSVNILIPSTWTSTANYVKPKAETYDKADVIIDTPYILYGDDPYTLQYKGCGDPGKFIHFTPNFLLDDSLISAYGDRGRVFVHEWAHLRWGIFDEYDSENPYYVSGALKVEATRCSTDIHGSNVIPIATCTESDCTTRPCNLSHTTGLYEDGCVFIPDKNQFSTESIMYMQALSPVSEFCDASKHNIEAPTLQNRMCNSRSTWDIISDSSDIKDTPPGTTIIIPEPTFSLLQQKTRVITLVLDISGNTNPDNRIGRLYQAADVFLIQIIELGSYVGIVEFAVSATIKSELLQIQSDAQRQTLKSLLPTTATGRTNACAGILAGIDVNKKLDGSSSGTELVLLLGGRDNQDTKLCYPDIISSGVIIHTIALGLNVDKELEEIAKMTDGKSYTSSDKEIANELIDAFSGLTADNGDITHETVQLESISENLQRGKCMSDTVFIDSTVGKSTIFLVTWKNTAPIVTIEDPRGNVYNIAQFTTDSEAKSARLEIPGTAERGSWNYDLCNPRTGPQVIGIVVSSMAADPGVPPISVTAHMNTDTNAYPNPMIVYALVSQGQFLVAGLDVTAIIEPTTGNPEIIQLLDNGAGADIIKNDGVYSSYFFGFKLNGRHSLRVRVKSKQSPARLTLPKNQALYVPGYVENGVVVMNPIKPSISEDDLLINFGPISRTASGGSFVISNVPIFNQKDVYNPGKIIDLTAKIEGNAVVLTWTASGDDLDQSTVAGYDLRMSTNPAELRDSFERCQIISISQFTPQPAGSSETFRFVPQGITIANGTILYFSLVAIDEVPHKSDPSNIAQAALLIPPTPPSSTTLAPPTVAKPTPITDSTPPNTTLRPPTIITPPPTHTTSPTATTTTTNTPPSTTTTTNPPQTTTTAAPSSTTSNPSNDSNVEINLRFTIVVLGATVVLLFLTICVTVCVVSCERNRRLAITRA